MTIQDWQKEVDDWIEEYGVRYFNEMTNLAILMEEVGEFARLIARKYGEQSFKKEKTIEEVNNNIKDEMGDVLFVLTCLANQMDIDLSTVLAQNLAKKTNRDNVRHLKNEKLT